MLLDQDQLLLDLSGFTLTTTQTGFTTPSLVVAESAGVTGNLEIRNGNLATTDVVRIGDYGAGTMTLSNGAKINTTGSVYLGFWDGSSGTMNLSGVGTSWTAGSQQVGNIGDATINVSNGASLVTTEEISSLGGRASSHGFVTVTGPGSSWTGPQNDIIVGSAGHGTLTVNDRGIISAKALKLADQSGSVGIANLDGATTAGRSTISVGGLNTFVSVADEGAGTLNITHGALLTDGGIFYLGNEPGASGAINVSGAAGGYNAELRITGDLQMARSIADNPDAGGGDGALTIGSGGIVTVAGKTYLGSTGVGAGAGVITLDGGSFTTHGFTASTGSGIVFNAGTLVVNGGTFAPSSDSLALVGADDGDNATLKLTNSTTMNLTGGLSVGGSATAAGPGTGLLSIESGSSASFGGPTQLWTGGAVNVAGTLKTSAVQRAGGTLNFISGGIYLTGSDLTFANGDLLGQSLTLMAGTGNRNTLSVSGTTTIDSGASLFIKGGNFSTGKLVSNGGTFSFETGSFSITNGDLTIGVGSPVGSNVNLTTGRSLSVSGAVTIDAGASLTLNGGAFSAASLINNGSFNFISGTLGGSSDLVIDPGQLLGADLTLGTGRSVSSSQALLVGKRGAATLTLTGGGTATSVRGYVGQLAGSSGTVSISGAGSKWNLSSTLAVGGSDSAAGGAASLNISNGGAISAGSTIKLYPAATVKLDSGSLSGSSITNQGQFELANASTVSGTFNNSTTLKKTGPGAATLNGTLNNTGALQLLDGTLTLGKGAGVSSGSFSVAQGTTLRFGGSNGFDPDTTLSSSASLSGDGSVSFISGWHVFNTPVNVAQLTFGNAFVDLNADSTATRLVVNAPSPSISTGVSVAKTLNVSQMDFSGGTVGGAGVVNVSGDINLTGTGFKTINGVTINASGHTIWTDGGIVGMGQSTFNNLAGATFELKHTASPRPIYFGGGGAVFNNYGTLVKSTGDFFVEIASKFNNYGSVDLQKGSLLFSGGGTHSGSITGAAGTTLVIGDESSEDTTFLPTSTVTTAGDMTFGRTPVNFSGHLNIAGSTLIYNAAFLSGADLQSLGSDMLVRGHATFSTGLPQNLPATTLYDEFARVDGTDDLSTAAPFNWGGGTLAGTGHVRLNAGGTLSSTSPKSLTAGTLDNAGTLVWTGGTFNQHATFNNLAGGTLDIRGSDPMEIDFSAPAGSAVFNNAGALIKSAGNGTVITPRFSNTGSVDVQTGMLVFGRDSASTGSFSVSRDASLVFAFGTHTFDASSSITGAGNVLFSESTANLAGHYTVTGSTTVGSATASGSTTPVTFEPGSSASELGSLLTINTYGTLALNTGNTVTIHDLTIWGKLTGTDKVIIDGQVTGRGTIDTEIVNAGTFSPGASPGTLDVVGNYTQDPSASLKIEIAALSLVGPKYLQQFDILDVTGQAHLAGTLDVSTLDDYQPKAGDRFQVLTYAGHSGQFDQVVGSQLPGGLHFDVVYGSRAMELVVATPEPSALSLLCFAGLLVARPLRRGKLQRR
jgi:T5SS/PEP-CTERM-associated repeat protein